jgi:hypothetical protein
MPYYLVENSRRDIGTVRFDHTCELVGTWSDSTNMWIYERVVSRSDTVRPHLMLIHSSGCGNTPKPRRTRVAGVRFHLIPCYSIFL